MKIKSILLSFVFVVTSGAAHASDQEYERACQKIQQATSAEIAATIESIRDFLKESYPAGAASYKDLTDKEAEEALLGICEVLYDKDTLK